MKGLNIKIIKSLLFIILIIILSVASYFGGLILPLGLFILIITLLAGLIISIIGVFQIIKNMRVNIIAFTVLFVCLGVFIGHYQDYYTTNKR